MAAKNVILKAKIDGIITEIMVKTVGEMVYLDDNTTLSSKIAEMILAINEREKTTDVEAKIAALKQEMLGDTPIEAYNTFTELAQYIEEHEEAADALTEAIGTKADASTVTEIQNTLAGLGALATKSQVSEADLDTALKEKVNAAAEGNHAHENKTVLDGITATKVADWDDAVVKEHEHSNKDVLDGITAGKIVDWDDAVAKEHEHDNKDVIDAISAEKVAAWDGKANVYVSASEPSGLTANDLWIQTL